MAEFYDSEVMREVARWDAKMASVTGKATSISVEPRIWDYFCTIAPERGVTVGQLLSYVEAAGAFMSGLPLRCARPRARGVEMAAGALFLARRHSRTTSLQASFMKLLVVQR